MVVNIVILVIIIAVGVVIAVSLGTPVLFYSLAYGLPLISFLLWVFSLTIRDFFKNIRIVSVIEAGHYDLDIEDYAKEMDLEQPDFSEI